MTTISRVTAKQMHQKTGLRTALGYALPKEDKILIRKGLPKDLEKEVLGHEEKHIGRGEEGPFLGALLGAGASILGGIFGSRSADRATDAQVAASDEEIRFARESRDMARADAAPYREAGYTALDALMSLTGLGGGSKASAPKRPNIGGRRGIVASDYLSGLGGRRAVARYGGGPVYNINEMGPESRYEGGSYTRNPRPQTIEPGGMGYIHPRVNGGPVGFVPRGLTGGFGSLPGGSNAGPIKQPPQPGGPPTENPGGVEGGFNFQTDPGYEFRVDEGMRALDRGAAASGGLLSGGYARRAIRYGQDYASNEYTNVYNRIANIAGLGQVSAGQSGQAALYAGAQMGNAASNAGAARASGYTAQGNARANAINQIGQLPWDEIFKDKEGTI
jgi:hypothetical protein